LKISINEVHQYCSQIFRVLHHDPAELSLTYGSVSHLGIQALSTLYPYPPVSKPGLKRKGRDDDKVQLVIDVSLHSHTTVDKISIVHDRQ